MARYIIERTIKAVGTIPIACLEWLAAPWTAIVDEVGGERGWLHSYLVAMFDATRPEPTPEHVRPAARSV